jgi:ribosomal protein S1
MLPHIMALESCKDSLPATASTFNNVKVESIVFGSSFIVSLKDKLNGFLHKSHVDEIPTDATEEEEKAAPKFKPRKTAKGTSIYQRKKPEEEALLKVGQVLPQVRVKENNYFDGMPILSCREDVLKADALNYGQIKVGMVLNATTKGLSKDGKGVNLKVNSFVKGLFPLEHMAEMPLKNIPPKFEETDKEIKVRVFSVDENSRSIIFTKKDTFMKEDMEDEGMGEISSVKKGHKVMGVVVGETSYGYVVKSFGSIKGLLTFADIKGENAGPYKVGQIVKTYCLFNKKNSGLALTVNKKKCKESSNANAITFESFLPDTEASNELKKTYKSMIAKQECSTLIGKSFNFKIAEEKSTYYIVKAVRDEDSNTKIAAIVPKCLA